ncbi:uncharacterized protein (TIGR02302 family) [Dichotomicrobium thermohalophilum]|uniref:Uncharacterized protein (TIGR02302 family) n=2 Tax=Dichotomicrobium thermohalophilum TaxID=933063 RepID=A0A397QE21_9HYPH|nr:uncharacterized protein (TIGR02302 family) [Dichotomicrobium thermohalophilum]
MRRVILLERLWPRLWLPLGVAGTFVLVSLLGLWPLLGRTVHLALLWAFAIAFVASLVPVLRVSMPTREEALRRLEERSGVPHRPATALQDQPAGETSAAARSLWQAYRRRMAAAVEKLKPGTPHPRTDRLDPFALRALLGLLLIVAVTATWGQMRERIATAFDLGASKTVASLRLDAWIAPPVYTGQPPITLASGPVRISEAPERREWEVPEGSELTIRVNNAAPEDLTLDISADGKSEDLALESPGDASAVATLKHKLDWSQTATLRHNGQLVAAWPISVIADDPPMIQFSEEPAETQRKAVQLSYKAEDDYGLTSAIAEFRLLDDEGEARLRDGPWPAPEISLPLSGSNMKSVENQTFKDLTAHPWAGLPVEVVLKARDVAGQTGYSEPKRFTLPAREFTKPLAKAVIEQRRELVADPHDVRGVVRMLDALTLGPDKFFDDKVVYLGLRSAYWRLVHETGIESVKSVVDQLWTIALRIEDGDLSDAEARLRQAQEALRKALEEDASPEEIERLMQELRTALAEFMRELAERAQQQAGQTGEMPPMDPSRMLSAQDLDQMLQDIEDLAKTGSREQAQQMLSQLRNMLENLRAGQPGQSQQAQQMMEMLKKFSEIVQEQQRLLDETYRAQRQGQGPGQPQQGQQGQQGQQFGQGQMSQRGQGQQGQGQQGQRGQGQRPGQGQFGQLGGQQRELEEALRRLMEQMRQGGAQVPGELDGAGEAMGEAGEALGQGDGQRATQQQTLALDRLRQGAQNMAQQILQQLGQQRMGAMGPGMRGRDPLGRPQRNRGTDTGDSVEIPEEFSVERAREILRELRRRLGDPSRPSIELEYLERLIERF